MPIKTLVVDDSVTYRKILTDIIATIPEIDLLGTAPTGSIALKKISQADIKLVFLDAHMPEMNGVETLKKIRAQFPDVIVVMMSSISSRNSNDIIEALQNGAIDFIHKPDGMEQMQNALQLKNDIVSVIRLTELRINVNSITDRKPVLPNNTIWQTPEIPAQKLHSSYPSRFGVCVIGVSTGGPEALNKLIPQLPEKFPLPILIVQHMPPLFTNSLAENLNRKSKLKIIEAPENEVITPGTVYIAPGGKHMVVRSHESKLVIGYNNSPPENSCRPSIDVLFRSVACYYGDQGVLALILTGMGNDGCSGIRALKRTKCYCITQSESSCVVYGMPRAVDEAGLSDISLPIETIASEVQNITNRIFPLMTLQNH